jgi:hypothetical protein
MIKLHAGVTERDHHNAPAATSRHGSTSTPSTVEHALQDKGHHMQDPNLRKVIIHNLAQAYVREGLGIYMQQQNRQRM